MPACQMSISSNPSAFGIIWPMRFLTHWRYLVSPLGIFCSSQILILALKGGCPPGLYGALALPVREILVCWFAESRDGSELAILDHWRAAPRWCHPASNLVWKGRHGRGVLLGLLFNLRWRTCCKACAEGKGRVQPCHQCWVLETVTTQAPPPEICNSTPSSLSKDHLSGSGSHFKESKTTLQKANTHHLSSFIYR